MECQTQRLKYCTGCEWCCLSQGGFDYPLTILWQAGANQYSLMRDWVDWRQHFRLEMKTCLLNAGLLHLSEYLSELLLIDRYQTPMIVFSVHEDHHSLYHTFRDFWLFFLSSIVSSQVNPAWASLTKMQMAVFWSSFCAFHLSWIYTF